MIKLLVQDLMGRQLYGVRFEYKNGHGKIATQTLESIIHNIGLDYRVIGNKDTVGIDNCRPFLFSLKSIESQVDFYGQKVCVLEELENKDIVIVEHKGTIIKTLEYEIIDYVRYYDTLDYFHVDYRGLIREDLAILVDKTNNPYK